jgi:hypothetical protein
MMVLPNCGPNFWSSSTVFVTTWSQHCGFVFISVAVMKTKRHNVGMTGGDLKAKLLVEALIVPSAS